MLENENGQGELLDVKHEGQHRKRLRKPDGTRHWSVNPERIYLGEWKRRNRGLNNYLGMILGQVGRHDGPAAFSRRDALVAATVIQWLGTNVGLGFIETCEKKIDEARNVNRPSLVARRREWRQRVRNAEAAKKSVRSISLKGDLSDA